MSKSQKRLTIPKLEEWKAPWEATRAEDGTEVDVPEDEQVIDKQQLKKYIWSILNDKINFRNSLDETTAEAEELRSSLENAKTPEELKALQEENARLLKERDEAKSKAKGDANALKWEIALEKGLTKTQAKRLVGATREELEADADELIAEFGHRGKGGDENGGEGDEVRRGPRRNLNNAGDPNPEDKTRQKEPDPAEVARNWLANR